MKDRLTVAVCGAESACGQEMLTLLGDRGFPCQGVLAFGSPDPEGFTRDMGVELVAFLARVVERTAERWPVL